MTSASSACVCRATRASSGECRLSLFPTALLEDDLHVLVNYSPTILSDITNGSPNGQDLVNLGLEMVFQNIFDRLEFVRGWEVGALV